MTEELLEKSECKTAFNVSNDLVSEFDNKTKQFFEKDVISFTVMCFYKPNKVKFGLSEQKQSEILKTCFAMWFVQAVMLIGMSISMFEEWMTYKSQLVMQENSFILSMLKLLVTAVVHMLTYRFFKNGLYIMKFVNNHPEEFESPQICFMLGFLQFFGSVLLEFINMIILFTKATVFLTITAYGTQYAVITLMQVYFAEIINIDRTFKLREIMDDKNAPEVTWRNKDHKFKDRNCLQKINRVLYLVCRAIFVCVIYYFGPLIYFLVT